MEKKKFPVEITVRKAEMLFLKESEMGFAEQVVVDIDSCREVEHGVSVVIWYDEPCYLFWLGIFSGQVWIMRIIVVLIIEMWFYGKCN